MLQQTARALALRHVEGIYSIVDERIAPDWLSSSSFTGSGAGASRTDRSTGLLSSSAAPSLKRPLAGPLWNRNRRYSTCRKPLAVRTVSAAPAVSHGSALGGGHGLDHKLRHTYLCFWRCSPDPSLPPTPDGCDLCGLWVLEVCSVLPPSLQERNGSWSKYCSAGGSG